MESEEKGDKRTTLRVRTLASGAIVTSRRFGGGPLLCLNDRELWDTTTRKVFSLPSLKAAGKATCAGGGAEAVLALGDRSICLDAEGKVHDLVRSP